MKYKVCPCCGSTGITENICRSCGFDFSTDAEHYETFVFIQKQSHRNTLRWTDSKTFWDSIKILRNSVHSVVFQSTLFGVPDEAVKLIDAAGRTVYIWMRDKVLFLGANGKIHLPQDVSLLFFHLKNVKSIYFGKAVDTSGVINMHAMFLGCGKLESLDISGFDTKHVTDMSDMFYGCGRLSKLDLSEFDISNVTSLSNMFYGCCKLTDLNLFSFDSSNDRNIEDMFYGCASLPQGKYFLPVLDKYSLRSIISNANRKLFWGLSGISISAIKTITFRKNIAYAPMDAQDLSLKNDRSILAWMNDGNLFIASNGIIEFPSNASYMFSGMDNLVSIDFNCCVDTSKVTDMHNMFCNSSRLTKLDLSCFDTSNVTDMSWMFAFCNSLAAVDVSSFNTSKVINMSNMFYTCGSLKSLNLKDFRTPQATNMRSMFSCCYNLESLILTGFDSSCVSNMFAMFDRSRKLNTLLCSDSHILEEYKRKR